MNTNNFFILYITIGVLIIIVVSLSYRLQKLEFEHLTSAAVSSNEGLQTMSSMLNSGSSTLTNLTLTGGLAIGDLTIDSKGNIFTKGTLTSGDNTTNGSITVTNGGNFSGGRYYFNDTEKCGRLRVGCAWGKPGIYTEHKDANCTTCSDELIIGSASNNMIFNGNHITSGSGQINGTLVLGSAASVNDYTLIPGTDGFRISTGAANDAQRIWFKRNPGKRNM